MKAVRYHRYGDSDVLEYEDAPRPVPGPRQVLIEVAATSFNPVDAGIRGGYLAEVYKINFPHTPGVDVSGTIAEIGEGVAGWNVGDAVVAFLPLDADGAAAEYAIAPAESLAAAPTSVPLADAAALPEAGLTAWQSLFEIAGLTEWSVGPDQRRLGCGGRLRHSVGQAGRRRRHRDRQGRVTPTVCAATAQTASWTTSTTPSPRSPSRVRPSTWCSTWCAPPTSRPKP